MAGLKHGSGKNALTGNMNLSLLSGKNKIANPWDTEYNAQEWTKNAFSAAPTLMTLPTDTDYTQFAKPTTATDLTIKDETTLGVSNSTWSSMGSGASIGLMIGQAIGNAYSAYKQGKTQAYVQKKQAQIEEAQAQLAQLGAERAFRAGADQVAKITQQAAMLKARQRVAFASNGVAVGVGTSAEVMASTDINKERDRLAAESNALAAAWGYKSQAMQHTAQAKILRNNAARNKSIGVGNAFSTLLGGLGKAASAYGDLSTSKVSKK